MTRTRWLGVVASVVACGGDGGGGAPDAPRPDAPDPIDAAATDAAVDAMAIDAPSTDAPMVSIPIAPQAYLKSASPGVDDELGRAVALSTDGSTLAVGVWREDGNGVGTSGDPTDDSREDSGAVFVFRRNGTTWSQEAYLKASNPDPGDGFGFRVSLAGSGDVLAVSAPYEASAATGVDGTQTDNSLPNAGAVYVFRRSGATWAQEAYLKASNPGNADVFGIGCGAELSADGATLAVCAPGEDSSAVGIDGNQASEAANHSGAVYVFRRGASAWAQEAYVKATNTGAQDDFGVSAALSADGSTLAVGAYSEDGSSSGIGGDQTSNGLSNSGAVYVYRRTGSTWAPEQYLKATNADAGDAFGSGVALSASGELLVVGAWEEASGASGVNGDQSSNAAMGSGAVYVYTRSGTTWSPDAYVKAAQPTGASGSFFGDQFGYSVAMASDGTRFAVGAFAEASRATGMGGDQSDEGAPGAGAAFLFERVNNTWAQGAYVKATNTQAHDVFGLCVALSGDGQTLAVGAPHEDSASGGIMANQADNAASDAGAVYVYR